MKRQRHSDRLGALPNEMLQRILCHLKSNEAMRTSTLSRRWRDVHAAIPIVHVVDHKKGNWWGRLAQLGICFDQKVTGAFLCKTQGTPNRTLRLDMFSTPFDLIDQWIISAVYFGTEEIDVKLGYGPNTTRLCPFISSGMSSGDFVYYQGSRYAKT
jgi:hypothetical protein